MSLITIRKPTFAACAVVGVLLCGIRTSGQVRIPVEPLELGDTTDVFEHVVITAHQPAELRNYSITMDDAGLFTAINVTLRDLALVAFPTQSHRLAGGPDWTRTERYDIRADASHADRAYTRGMMRRLLMDRFKLQITTGPRQVQIFRLVRAKGQKLGRGIRPPAAGCEQPHTAAPDQFCDGASGFGPALIFVRRGRVTGLLPWLRDAVTADVVDETDLKGLYDIDVKFTPEAWVRLPFQTADPPSPERPSIFVAIREQLGLELQPAMAERNVHWIERVERPVLD
jgi:uncharacterized protein (TIGR03435 family)